MKTPHQLALEVGATVDYNFTSEQLEAFVAAVREEGKESKPKLEFTPGYAGLIERVRKIDPSAAEYLAGEEIRELGSFGQNEDLKSIMVWSCTPQGFGYWCNINEQLGEN